MPGRVGLFADARTLEDRFDVMVDFEYEPRYNVAPETDLATVRNDDPEIVVETEWGFVAPWDENQRLINARAETAAEKRTFEAAFAERRCLVLASGYYEWQGRPTGPKQPY